MAQRLAGGLIPEEPVVWEPIYSFPSGTGAPLTQAETCIQLVLNVGDGIGLMIMASSSMQVDTAEFHHQPATPSQLQVSLQIIWWGPCKAVAAQPLA